MFESIAKVLGADSAVLKKIGIPLIIGIFVFFVVRWLINNAPEKSLTDEIKVNTSDLTYPISQYGLWADNLFNAMDGGGTGESTIYNILEKLQSVADWNQLLKSYGTRTLRTLWVVTCTGTLSSCLQSELKDKELRKVYEILGNIGVVL